MGTQIMATVIQSTSATATTRRAGGLGERRFVLYNVGWKGYQGLLEIVGDHGPRIAYSQGNVELMSPLLPHEGFGRRLGRIVETIGEELEIPIRPAKSMTLNREDLDRGIEPDESYYIANVGRIGSRMKLDFEVDPPPDLAIEIEITNSILDKIEIYARLGVPELWRFDGEVLSVLLLQHDGSYAASTRSAAFPFLPMHEVARFVLDPDMSDESRWGRSFRRWVRNILLPIYRTPPAPE
jgi:Uma2 family endonuclease